MQHPLSLGVFIPIGNNGWIISKNAPQYLPTYTLNKEIALLAEKIGFDFIFSMVKWRGFDGETKHWNYTLESFTLMSALAAVTERIRIVASVQPLLIPPAVAAKMAVTVDEVSNGRFGMNIVAGTFFDEYAQMGLLPEGYDQYRYDYTEEWVRILKRLWTEASVTYHGKYFDLEDCRSDPKPLQQPHPPLVCAGISERGMQFTAEHGNEAFIAAQTLEETKKYSRQIKEKAQRDFGRSIKTNTVLILVQAATDEQAQEIVSYYREGADVEALSNMFHIYSQDSSGASSKMLVEMAKQSVFYGNVLAGSPATIANQLEELAVEGQLDGVLFCFPDYLKGLKDFQVGVMPLLAEKTLIAS